MKKGFEDKNSRRMRRIHQACWARRTHQMHGLQHGFGRFSGKLSCTALTALIGVLAGFASPAFALSQGSAVNTGDRAQILYHLIILVIAVILLIVLLVKMRKDKKGSGKGKHSK